ncbi:DNA-binding transcriptional LysR family regulator [Kibdelosporangium banguiense]|uniref:DNA-binding transcriptional LysR family regulator n=1 Tax=Kibdelosporangium banguiense TaxID=1365924 RepID=A0ABS4TBZ1_9PSEU|nr:LysR family transcriptional regulator [Kibdelosporangium banguiense]MBP2321371.1 DNA-binding transcriptional LysR family regulator [Kibdelosporangium banguiense]
MAELELRHLRAVCAIAEEGSVTKAAARLGLTQPALSAQLRSVERLVGGQLFERTPAGSIPTDLGRYVIRSAHVVLEDLSQLLTSARERASVPSQGPFVAAAMPMLWVSQLVEELRARFRCTEVRTEIDWSWQSLLDMLVSKRANLAVFDYFEGVDRRRLTGVEVRTLLHEPQFVAVSEESPLASYETIPLAELEKYDWVALPPDYDSARMQLHTACAALGFTPRITHHVIETGAARALVSAGAVSLASPASRNWDGIAIRPLRGDPISIRVMLATRTDGLVAGRAHEAFACAAHAYRAVVDRNPHFTKWWAEHPQAHAELDAALRLARPSQPQ